MDPEDKADEQVDGILKELEKRIQGIYTQAEKDLDSMIDHYYKGWDEIVENLESGDIEVIHHAGMYERYKEQIKLFNAEKWKDQAGNVVTDQKAFDKWWYAQEGRGQHWIDLRDQMAQRLTETNEIAAAYINGELPKVYTTTNNAVASLATKSAMRKGITGIKFDLVDEYTVRNLVMGKRKVFPFHLVKLDPEKDTPWNQDKLQNALLQGVLQGDPIERIAKRFMAVENMNLTSAIRNARTATTAARNAGKQDRYKDLEKRGCETTKIWMDVHDSIPPERETHWKASGQEVPSSEPFIVGGYKLMFPGDTSMGARGCEIYNCRCRTKTGKIIFKSMLSGSDINKPKRKT